MYMYNIYNIYIIIHVIYPYSIEPQPAIICFCHCLKAVKLELGWPFGLATSSDPKKDSGVSLGEFFCIHTLGMPMAFLFVAHPIKHANV